MNDELVAHFGIASPQLSAVAFVILILSGFPALRCGATVYHSNGTVANVQALHNHASDGDIITLPAGTFTWTTRVSIKKGITLQGETTITGAGTSKPIVADNTIIRDDTPRTGAIVFASIGSFRSFRLTGITFAPGSIATDGTTDAMHLVSDSSSTIRIDHCHFGQLHQIKIIGTLGDIRGVADHNYIEVIANHFPFNFRNDTYGGKSFGDGAWADYPWYGTDKFFFAEDNTIVRVNATAVNTLADASLGARYVLRHNYVKNCMPANHGTEGRGRSTRVHEVYSNVFEITIPWGGGGTRGGTLMWHDNNFIGVKPAGNQICHYANFRNFRLTKPYWLAIGDSPWDKNDTEGNGTYVEGHAPYLFESGTATSSTVGGTLVDSTKNWTPNQWKGYSIKCSSGVAAQHGSYITSNTSNTITYYHDPGAIQDLVFNSGDSYQIRRCLQALDQCGSGKGDLLSGSNSTPINTRTGTTQWPRNAVEPCYTWNNVYTPDGTTLVSGGKPRENLFYFDLGAGFPSNTTPSAVSSRYTAALNGVNYIGTFVYPHPLVTAQPLVAAQPTSTQCSLLQRRLDRLQRRQQRLERRHRANPRLRKRISRLQLRLQRLHCP
jgi:pectate lyase